MKPWFYSSLALNLVLTASMGYLVTRQPAPPKVSQLRPLQPTPEIRPAPSPKPFHWSQIESEDFPVYVANLRSIGCPETTIRDIVAAELKEIYDEKRRSVARDVRTGPERRAAEAQYQKLAQEENAVVARALGSGSSAAGKSAATSGDTNPAIARAPRVFYPTVFQDPGGLLSQGSGSAAAPTTPVIRGAAAAPQPVLTPGQTEAVRQLQQQFVEDIGGPHQNPADPAYLKRWQSAQQASDDSLRAQIGWSAFSDYQLALEQKEQAGTPPAK